MSLCSDECLICVVERSMERGRSMLVLIQHWDLLDQLIVATARRQMEEEDE